MRVPLYRIQIVELHKVVALLWTHLVPVTGNRLMGPTRPNPIPALQLHLPTAVYQTILKQWLKPMTSHNSLATLWQHSAGCFFNFMFYQQGSLKEAAFGWEHNVQVFGAMGWSISGLLHLASPIQPLTKIHSVEFKLLVWKHFNWVFKSKSGSCQNITSATFNQSKSSPHKRMKNRLYGKEQCTCPVMGQTAGSHLWR